MSTEQQSRACFPFVSIFNCQCLSVLFVYLLLFCLCQTESGEQMVFKKNPESLIVTVIVCKHRSPQLNSSPSS